MGYRRDQIPFFEDLGHGVIRMDIAPDDGCLSCGHWKWGYALVNTAKRHDLLTDKELKDYSAKSDCLKCGITTIWNPDPDIAYPLSNDDPFAK